MNAVAQLRPPVEVMPEPELLHAALDACSQSMAVSEGGQIIFANPAFAQRLGVNPREQLVGRSLSSLISRQGTNDDQPDASSSPGGLLHISATPLPIPKRQVLLLTTTEPAALELPSPPSPGQMEALGRMVGGVAHDFNNLLTGILLYCELLGRALEGNARLKHYIDEMRGAGEQAASLIQHLMEVARQPATEPVALSWNEAIRNLHNLLARLIGENIQLTCNLDPELGLVHMRPAQMPQIILNLALNARDAMPSGGNLTLRTRNLEPGGWIEFTASDNGCGMSEEIRSRLLQPFFTTKPPGQGNGLGLATVRRIAEEQRGVLELESSVGKGTRVTVRLPRIARDLNQKGNPI